MSVTLAGKRLSDVEKLSMVTNRMWFIYPGLQGHILSNYFHVRQLLRKQRKQILKQSVRKTPRSFKFTSLPCQCYLKHPRDEPFSCRFVC